MNDVAIKVDPMKAFIEKLEARMRDDIRDLLPDDALKGVIERAIGEVFFKPQTVKTGSGWNERTEQRPSMFCEMLMPFVKELVEAQAKAFFDEHRDEFKKQVDDYLDVNRLAVSLSMMMTNSTRESLMDIQVQIAGMIR